MKQLTSLLAGQLEYFAKHQIVQNVADIHGFDLSSVDRQGLVWDLVWGKSTIVWWLIVYLSFMLRKLEVLKYR